MAMPTAAAAATNMGTGNSRTLVWLITGCSSGLGLALVRYALSKGHIVVATSRNPSKTPGLATEVEGLGGKWLTLDTTKSEQEIKATIQQAESLFGRIDVLVNNAGYCVLGALEDIPDEEVVAQMRTNFLGPLRLMKAVLPEMRKRRSGVILNVSSTQGLCPSLGCSIYAASKAALEAASQACSSEVAPFGIRVLIVEPGAFRTGFALTDVAKYIQPSEEYAGPHPVGQRLDQIQRLPGLAAGDPSKAARVMFNAVTGEGDAGSLIKQTGLLRVILGPDCWRRVNEQVNELRRTADLLKDIAASTDF
ncbi:hypothetical protein HRR83_009538 [Exophiala dermatitidis]|uniref:Short chain oxidoreductase/dehydrogenase n=2 Tax=Exophiala dermatitidis TaxID=5970 RepID=H6BLL1_EXODN|nr:uncharacterized protein HMPREF1120_00128 [Exophiala dermatitidis NIH/UT8656]KAJ4514582.1 hypothetical protein HRR75_003946 [Exophiala dermatitidis]EHY51905.1 hypothetical protein HMPREF1120_00128 [Exophiala dermatitidis NIH/UT8656]KAJ4518011.1 hypothetical protein HRR74_004306 [Exophiala dermatitidis]KAJ4520910.1 hypothetical protein HRR73_003251 [Exophiala dermatitidis]KAJ4546069.1 hypothetical protein HRR78_005908 [Exophiala dermatitidis]